MNNNKAKDLIREYVSEALVEYADLPNISDETISKHLIQPFVRLGKAIAGSAKEISSKAITVLQTTVGLIVTTFIPFVKVEYDEIFEADKVRTQKIRDEYAHVYDEIRESIGKSDMLWLAFAYNPSLFLSTYLIKKSPGAVKNLLSIVSGGALDDALSNIKSVDDLKKIANNKKVSKHVDRRLADISQKSVKSHKITLDKVWLLATTLLAAKTLKDLNALLGKSEAAETKKSLKKLEQLPPDEKQKSDEAALDAVKASVKKFFIKDLNDKVNTMLSQGIDESNSLVTQYVNLINKIKRL